MQTQLAQRVMRFVQHLHLLIPAVRSSALRPQEEKLRGMLDELEEEMRRARVKSRLNELWALIGAVGASAERANNGGGSGLGSGGPGEWAVVDEEGLAQIAQILGELLSNFQSSFGVVQILLGVAELTVCPDIESAGLLCQFISLCDQS